MVDVVQTIGVVAFLVLMLLQLALLPWWLRKAPRCPDCGSRTWARLRIERRWRAIELDHLGIVAAELEPVEVIDCGQCKLWASRP